MKKYVWLPLILTAVIGSAAVTTKAQSTRLRASVPFDFIVGDKTLPAGKISVSNITSDMGTLAISNVEKRQTAMRIAHNVSSSNSKGECKLVFRKYGNHYYLGQVWRPGYPALELNRSKSERAEPVNVLSKNSTPEVVTISADME